MLLNVIDLIGHMNARKNSPWLAHLVWSEQQHFWSAIIVGIVSLQTLCIELKNPYKVIKGLIFLGLSFMNNSFCYPKQCI